MLWEYCLNKKFQKKNYGRLSQTNLCLWGRGPWVSGPSLPLTTPRHQEDPLEKGKATHSSVLAWRIPWTVSSMGSQRVRQDWTTFTFNSPSSPDSTRTCFGYRFQKRASAQLSQGQLSILVRPRVATGGPSLRPGHHCPPPWVPCPGSSVLPGLLNLLEYFKAALRLLFTSKCFSVWF